MKRATVVMAALVLCGACGCMKKYMGGVSKTVCETWIYSSPHGARLYLNGRYVGRTPYKYTAINNGDSSAHFIARDLSDLTVRKRGYDDEVEVLTVANCYKKLNIENKGVEDQVKRYKGHTTFYMDEKEYYEKKGFGNVVIKAFPEDEDAEIYINDSLVGNGKTSLLKLPEGNYVLKVRKPGYKTYARIISVLSDNDITITANLVEVSEAGGEGTPQIEAEEIEAEEIELTPAGEEAELEEDEIPGTIGGKE